MTIYPITQDDDGDPIVVSATAPPTRTSPGVVVRVASNAADNDLFGRLRITEPTVVFASSPACGLDPYAWQTMTSGEDNGVAWNRDTRSVDFTLTSAGYVVRQSYRHIPYELGRPVRQTLTGNFGNDVAGVVREFGQYDAANGTLWRRQASGMPACVVRSSTSGSAAEVVISQADLNLDTLDGTGPSGFALDLSKNNVYLIEYVWLGAFAVRWGVATDRGVIYCHQYTPANMLEASYMQTACLPMRWAIYAAEAPENPATMRQVCAELESEGGYAIPPSFTFAARRLVANAIAAAAAPNYAPIVALRPALTVGAEGLEITNRVQALVEELEVFSSASADWALFYYPPGNGDPVTGGSWARVAVPSSVEANVAGTALNLTNAIQIAGGIATSTGTGSGARGQASATIQQTLPLALDACGANSPLTSTVGANPGYLVLAATGTGNVAGVLNLREIR